MSKKKWWILVPLILAIAYLMGPRPSRPQLSDRMPRVPFSADSLEQFIEARESAHKLRPDNAARIVWADSITKGRTEYVLLYVHGFSASQAEGEPVHRNIARKFGFNLYLPRLAEHGIDTSEQLIRLTADKLWGSAKEALAIATKLGEKVIVIGTSTGGTLALMLAARYPDVHSLVLLSPNIEIFDRNAWLLNNPWGLQVARIVTGSKYVFPDDTRPVYRQYWNYGYRLEAAVALEELLETAMKPSLFKKVNQPALMLYYYRDRHQQDSVVSVPAMLSMFSQLGTPESMKTAIPMPKAGNHVLGSYIKSQDIEGVEREIERFLTEKLGLKKVLQ